jgi:hypothetical protein
MPSLLDGFAGLLPGAEAAFQVVSLRELQRVELLAGAFAADA